MRWTGSLFLLLIRSQSIQASKDRASTWLLNEHQGDGSFAPPGRSSNALSGRAPFPAAADKEDISVGIKTRPAQPTALAELNPREDVGSVVDMDQSSQGTDTVQEPVGPDTDLRRGQRFKKVRKMRCIMGYPVYRSNWHPSLFALAIHLNSVDRRWHAS